MCLRNDRTKQRKESTKRTFCVSLLRRSEDRNANVIHVSRYGSKITNQKKKTHFHRVDGAGGGLKRRDIKRGERLKRKGGIRAIERKRKSVAGDSLAVSRRLQKQVSVLLSTKKMAACRSMLELGDRNQQQGRQRKTTTTKMAHSH